MGATQISVNANSQATPRSGFVYDFVQKGLDAAFWKTIAATASIASDKLRLTSGGNVSSYVQFKYGKFGFLVNVPTTPSAGEAKKWGLVLPGTLTTGSAYFEIAGAVFKCITYTNGGTVQSTTVTWDSWEAAETLFEIEWEDDYVIFKVAGDVVATHKTSVGTTPLSLYLLNSDADNTDFGSITIRETATFVS